MSETLFNRTVNLLQKSRKAVNLYKSINYQGNEPVSELKSEQARVWEEVNINLTDSLTSILKDRQKLGNQLKDLCVFYLTLANGCSKQITKLVNDLKLAADRSDFIKASLISRELVIIKAKFQACDAVSSELETILAQKVEIKPEEPKKAKVIQIRKMAS